RRVAGCARPRVRARVTTAGAGVAEPHRPRDHRARGRLRRSGGAGPRRGRGPGSDRARGTDPEGRARRLRPGVPPARRPRRRAHDRRSARVEKHVGSETWRMTPVSDPTRAVVCDSGGKGAALALECPLAADPAALPLRQPAPDAELLAVAQGVLEALGAHLAAPADRLRLLGGRTALREEEVRVDPQAVGLLLPATLGRAAVCRSRTGHQALCSDDLSHRPSPSGLSTRTARPPNDADV